MILLLRLRIQRGQEQVAAGRRALGRPHDVLRPADLARARLDSVPDVLEDRAQIDLVRAGLTRDAVGAARAGDEVIHERAVVGRGLLEELLVREARERDRPAVADARAEILEREERADRRG